MKKNKKTSKRKENGITLIALVITIIVLLILAGVSIAMLTGENGILTQAQNASRETGEASVIEKARLDVLAKQTEESGRTIYKEELKEILDKYFESVPDDYTLDTELQTKNEYGDYQILVSEIYNGELIGGPILAKDVLIPNENGTTEEEKSPFIMYNGILWRVLYNDETHGLQIITNGNTDDVTLGDEDGEKTISSYNNAIDTLNNKAKEYKGSKAIDARSLGSIATLIDGKFQGDTSGTTSAGGYIIKSQDKNYIEDYNQIRTLDLIDLTSSSSTWLASRCIYKEVSNYYIGLYSYFVRNDGSVFRSDDYDGDWTININSASISCHAQTRGLRPILLLSSDIYITKGNGTKEQPYVIE